MWQLLERKAPKCYICAKKLISRRKTRFSSGINRISIPSQYEMSLMQWARVSYRKSALFVYQTYSRGFSFPGNSPSGEHFTYGPYFARLSDYTTPFTDGKYFYIRRRGNKLYCYCTDPMPQQLPGMFS